MSYIWPSANLIGKEWYLCFNFQFCNYKWTWTSFHVFMAYLFLSCPQGQGRKRNKARMWSQLESCFSLVPQVAGEHELHQLPYLETKGVAPFYSHASQSLTRGWRCRVDKLPVEMAPIHWGSSLKKGTVVISLQLKLTAAERVMHTLLTGVWAWQQQHLLPSPKQFHLVALSSNRSRTLHVF